MSKTRGLYAVIAIIMGMLMLIFFACAEPIVANNIELILDGVKTEYVVGDEFYTDGMVFKISFSDSTNESYTYEQIKEYLEISNFSTMKEVASLRVTITYKKQISTYFDISVSNVEGARSTYTVKFETDTDTKIDDIKVAVNNTIEPPEDPVREGYYFDGWYSDNESFVNLWDFNTTEVKRNITLYAKWGKYLTVIFRPGNDLADIERKDIRPNTTYTNVPLVPEITGMQGVWNYAGEWDDLTNNQIIEAIYSPILYKVYFHFKNQSGTDVDSVLPYNFKLNEDAYMIAKTFIDELEIPKPNYKEVAGWRIRGMAGDPISKIEDIIEIREIKTELHIEAVYETVKYDVLFDFGLSLPDAKRYYTAEDIEYDQIITQEKRPDNETLLEGLDILDKYIFKSWYLDNNTFQEEWLFESDRVLRADIVLYAKWAEVLTVAFYGSGEYAPPTNTYYVEKGGSLITIPDPPYIEGKTTKWDIESDGFQNITTSFKVFFVENIKLYTIVFQMPNGEVLEVNGNYEQVLNHGSSIQYYPETPTLEHNEFVEWKCSMAGADFQNVTMDMTIFAVFTRIIYAVKFEVKGQSYFQIAVQSGDVIPQSSIPSNPDLGEDTMFVGWINQSTQLPWNLNEDVVVNDLTLIVESTPLYLVEFKDENGETLTSPIRVRSGRYIANSDIPTIATKVGHVGSWENEGFIVDIRATFITKDTEFILRYEKETYTIEFIFPDAQIEKINGKYEVNVKYGETINSPGTPTKTGYDFDYWEGYTIDMIATHSQTINARFTPWKLTVVFVVDDANVEEVEKVIGTVSGASYGQAVTVPGSVENYEASKGYKFIGWDTDITFLKGDKNSTIKVRAQFEKIYYIVDFLINTKVSELLIGSISIGHGDNIAYSTIETINETKEPDLVLSGHTFKGWNFELNAIESLAQEEIEAVKIIKETRIYAVFTLNSHTIELKNKEETIIQKEMQYSEVLLSSNLKIWLNEYKESNTDFMKDKAFMGWYTDPATTEKYVEGPINEDLILYGQWIEMTSGDENVIYEVDANRNIAKVTGYNGNKTEVESITVASHYTPGGEVISYEVKEISDSSFSGLINLKSVTFSTTIETIGSYAFNGCKGLTEIEIPGAVSVIAANAFKNCTNLETVIFSARGVVALTIGDSAFQDTIKLTRIYVMASETNPAKEGIPEGTYSIGTYAFSGATSLESIIIPSTIQSIGNSAFYGASSLRYAIFNKSMPPQLGNNVFLDTEPGFRIYVEILNNYENEVTSNDGWDEYKNKSKIYAFSNISYDGLWAYDVVMQGTNKNAKIIQYLGTEEEVVVDTIKITEEDNMKVAILASYVFNKKITKLTIPSDIEIVSDSLSGMSSLKHLIFIIKANVESYIERSYIKQLFDSNPLLTELSVTAVENIQDVFKVGLPVMLKTVNIIGGESTSLPEKMFYNVSSITKVTLPSDLVNIGAYAFAGCTNLTEVVFYDLTSSATLKTIGEYAFYNALKLVPIDKNTILIPASVTEIGLFALEKTKYLSNLENNAQEKAIVTVGDGILYKYVGSQSVVTIDSNIKKINDRAFYGNTTVVTVVSPNNYASATTELTEIGAEAFSGMTSLENVIIATGNLTLIDTKAFAGSPRFNKLAFLTLTQNIAHSLIIKSDAFQNTNEAFVIYLKSDAMEEAVWDKKSTAVISAPAINNEGWLVDNNTGSATFNVIAYLGSATQIEIPLTFTYSSGTGDHTPTEIGAFVFPQYIERITVDVSAPLNELAFDGLAKVKDFKIVDKKGNEGLAKGALTANNKKVFEKILKNNLSITQIEIPGKWTLEELFNGPTPSHLTAVKITASGTNSQSFEISQEMFKDAIYVTNITAESNLNARTSIGKDAFKNSGWLKKFSSEDGIVSLKTSSDKKIAVGYIGDSYYLKLDDTYIAISKYAFAGNETIEIIDLGTNIEFVDEYAFADMPSLIKIFIKKEDKLIEYGAANILNNNKNYQLFSYNKFVVGAGGSNYTPLLNEGATLKAIDNVAWSSIYIFDYSIQTEQYTLLQILEPTTVEIPDSYDAVHFSAYGVNILLKTVVDLTIKASQEFDSRSFENTKNLTRFAILNVEGKNFADNKQTTINNLIKNNSKLQILAYDASIKLKDLLGKENGSDIVLQSHVSTLEILNGTVKTVEFLLETAGKNISTMIMPQSLTEFGIGSFEGTNWYRSFSDYIIIQDGILYKYKGTSTQVTVPANVKIINERAFSRLDYNQSGEPTWSSYIVSIRFAANSKLTQIRSEAFYKAMGLMSMDLPGTIRVVSDTAFAECYFSQESIIIQNNGAIIVRGSTTSTYVAYKSSTQTVTIPADIKYILPNAFKNNTILETIIIPEGSLLVSIGSEAFSGCTALTTISVLPDGLEYIGGNAFKNTPWDGAKSNIITKEQTRLVYYYGEAGSTLDITEESLSSIRQISGGAFASLENANITISIEIIDLIEIETEAFKDIKEIFVPDQLVDYYKTIWSDWAEKIKSQNEK